MVQPARSLRRLVLPLTAGTAAVWVLLLLAGVSAFAYPGAASPGRDLRPAGPEPPAGADSACGLATAADASGLTWTLALERCLYPTGGRHSGTSGQTSTPEVKRDPDGAPAAAPISLTLNYGLHDALASGRAPRPDPIALTLLRSGSMWSGATIAPIPDGSGGFFYHAVLGGNLGYPAQIGDVVMAAQGGEVVSLTIPLLTALADAPSASIYGLAPPGTTLTLYAYQYDDPLALFQGTVTSTATGSYTESLAGVFDLRPRDYAYVFRQDEMGHYVYARANVPFLLAGIGGRVVEGVAAPLTPVEGSVVGPGHAAPIAIAGYTGGAGSFIANLKGPDLLRSGDTVAITAAGQSVSFVLPPLSLSTDLSTGSVSGQTLADAPVRAELYRDPPGSGCYESYKILPPDYSLTLTATTSGVYSADFSPLAGLAAADRGAVYVTVPSGHQAYRRFTIPFLQAHLGTYSLAGVMGQGSEPLTITVRSPGGVARDVRQIITYSGGCFVDPGVYPTASGLRLLPGDTVEVVRADETILLTLPLLTAAADWPRSLVSGQAPPNSVLRAGLSQTSAYPTPAPVPVTAVPLPTVPPAATPGAPPGAAAGGLPTFPQFKYNVTITTTAGGDYTADFSGLVQMRPGDSGAVFHSSPAGHQAYIDFGTPQLRAQAGTNHVTGILPSGVTSGQVRLIDVAGLVKGTADFYRYPAFEVSLSHPGSTPIIEAGDRVELTAGAILLAVEIPALTLTPDRETDTITGAGPAGMPLQITWMPADAWAYQARTWTVTPTVAGDFSLDLSDVVDLERGDRLEVTYTVGDGNQVWRLARIPGFDARLDAQSVTVYGPPSSLLTLRLLEPSGTAVYTWTTRLPWVGTASNVFVPGLRSGRVLEASFDGDGAITFALPLLTASVDKTADRLTGIAPPGARLMVGLGGYEKPSTWTALDAGSAGAYDLDLSAWASLQSRHYGSVRYLDPGGHRAWVSYSAPYVAVTIGSNLVSGVPPGQGPVTVTLSSGMGALKGSGTYPGLYGSAFTVVVVDAAGKPAPVANGDRVALETIGGRYEFVVPALSAQIERSSGIVSGSAPPGAWLAVLLRNSARHVLAGPDGGYALDFSDLPPRAGDAGRVSFGDALGNQVTAKFEYPYFKAYFPAATGGGQ